MERNEIEQYLNTIFGTLRVSVFIINQAIEYSER